MRAVTVRGYGGLGDVVAAGLPTASGAGLAPFHQLEPLADKTAPIVGAGGTKGAGRA